MTPTAAQRRPRRSTRLPRVLHLPLVDAAEAGPRLPPLKFVERHGPILKPNPLSSVVHAEVAGLNLTDRCASRCVFCYARAYPSHTPEGFIGFYVNTAEQLRRELSERRRQPRAVYLCPSADPFLPYRELQEETCNVVAALAEFGIEAWIMTRGYIRPFALDQLAELAPTVRVTIPMTTVDRKLQRRLEPLTASPRLRLKQLAALRARGIATQVAVDPLLPDLTDTRANLEPLLDALAEAGVEKITAGYAFLRHGIRANLERELPEDVSAPLLAEYEGGPVLPMAGLAPAQHLPRRERDRGYARLLSLAAQRGIQMSVSALSNPDFSSALPSSQSERGWRQQELACVR